MSASSKTAKGWSVKWSANHVRKCYSMQLLQSSKLTVIPSLASTTAFFAHQQPVSARKRISLVPEPSSPSLFGFVVRDMILFIHNILFVDINGCRWSIKCAVKIIKIFKNVKNVCRHSAVKWAISGKDREISCFRGTRRVGGLNIERGQVTGARDFMARAGSWCILCGALGGPFTYMHMCVRQGLPLCSIICLCIDPELLYHCTYPISLVTDTFVVTLNSEMSIKRRSICWIQRWMPQLLWTAAPQPNFEISLDFIRARY